MEGYNSDFVIDVSCLHSKCEIYLKGELVIESLEQFYDLFHKFKFEVSEVCFDCSELSYLDISGAFALKKILGELEQKNIKVDIRNLNERLKKIMDIADNISFRFDVKGRELKSPFLFNIGLFVFKLKDDIFDFLSFLGEIVVVFCYIIIGKFKIRIKEILYELEISGVNAIPIVSLVGLLCGIVLSYQGAAQLEKFGANIFIVDLISLSMAREMAPLLTSIMVSGRSGSAYTARIGSMMLNQEIDSLKIIGISPTELLVIPKLFAMMIALPLLIFIADIVGIGIGIYMSHFLLNLDFTTMLIRLKTSLSITSFLIGIFKGFIFAVPIVLISCFRGLSVKHNSDELGIKTTMSVVNTIFVVIVMDAILSIVFQKLGL